MFMGMEVRLRQVLFCGCVLLLVGGTANAGSIKCWTNNEGVRECGHTVPPEYSQKRIEILNERGVVVKIKDAAKTEAELKEERRLARLKKEQEQREAERRRQDYILLNTFTTERDLRLSHEGKLDVINGLIEISQGNIRNLQGKLAKIQKKIANYERTGDKAPDTLFDEMDNLKSQIRSKNEFIKEKKHAIEEINRKFEADLKRFRELKGIKPATTAE